MTATPGPPPTLEPGATEAAPNGAPQVAEWSFATRRLAVVLLLILVAGLAVLTRSVLDLVIVAGILAFLLAPTTAPSAASVTRRPCS